MGMFEAYENSSEERKKKRYRERLAANRGMAANIKKAEALAKGGYGGGSKDEAQDADKREAAVFEEEGNCDPDLKTKIDRALKEDLSFKEDLILLFLDCFCVLSLGGICLR